MATQLVITEFMAINDGTLPDEDDDTPDWIEIYNATDSAVDLGGWSLTDDAANRQKWQFPSQTLEAGDFLVVFASDKDRAVAGQPLHTNFKLRGSGEYLALVEPDGTTIASQYTPQFPQQFADVSFGLAMNTAAVALVPAEAVAAAFVPTDDSLGSSWTGGTEPFVETGWIAGTAGVGYEAAVVPDSGGYTGLFDIDLEAPMHNLRASAYVRVPFTVDDPTVLATLTLRMKYDDGFVAYINGVEVARANAPATPRWDSTAGTTRSDDLAVVFEDFDLSGSIGDLRPGTNILAIHGLNVGVESSDFLIVPELAGTLVTELTSDQRYFPDPTPGAANSAGYLGFVGDTSFDVDRGFYDAPFDVAITSTTADAEIRYTTDGSAPTATNGIVYDGSVAINTTTTLRAAAFKPGFQPTNVDTQTYIFLADVVRQPADPEGFPATWGVYGSEGPTGSPVVADYEFDPEVATDPRYAATIADDLLTLPTMSIVMDLDDLFDWDTGIYVDAHDREAPWERPASVEMFYPDGREGFQINAGIRTFGGYGRNAWGTPKHSFRLTFKSEYGPTKLNFPLFDGSPVDRFDQLVLRAPFGDAWPDAGARPQYLRDPFMRATQLAMGQPAARGTFVHLYLNGLYWGIYNPLERPNASYAAEHFGGDKEDYDAVKHVLSNDYEVIDGTGDAWSTALSLAGGGLADQAAYEQFKQYVDVVNLADYMIVNMYGGNTDWPLKNWYANRKREPGAGFRFYNWDGEYTLRSDSLNVDKTGVSNPNTPAALYAAARANAEFRLMFADRVRKHLFNDGALTPEANIARYEALAAEIDWAIVSESARWGDHEATRRGRPYHKAPGEVFTRDDDWLPVKEMVVNSYFPQRHDIVLNQFLAANLYPSVVAPTFNQHGGVISGTFELTVDAPNGTIYYTLDGSDPREVGGAVAGGALIYAAPVALTESTAVKARVLDGSTWSALNEAGFVVGSDTTPPSVPIGLTADVALGSRIDLSWQASTDAESGISHYRIFRDGVPIGTSLLTTFSDVDTPAPGTFAYQVSAVNGETLEGDKTVFPVVVELVVAEFRDGASPTAEYAGTRDATLSEDGPTANFGSSDNLVVATADSDGPQPRGVLYVTNNRNTGPGYVSSFDLPSTVDNQLPSDSRLNYSREVILGLDGNLLVASRPSAEVSKFDLTSQTWSTFATMPGSGSPFGMVIVGNELYVASGSGIEKFDAVNGSYLATIVTGLSQIPRGLAYANGLLYLSEGVGDDGIYRYDLSGNPAEPKFASTGVNPRGMTVGPNGNLFVAAISDSAIQEFDINTGALVNGKWNSGTSLLYPLDIAFADDGFAYVTDVGNNNVQRFDALTGVYDPSWSAGVSSAAWLLFVEADPPLPDHLESSSLLRWDLSEIAPDTAATSAAITIHVTEPPTGAYDLYEVRRPWLEDEATWNQFSAGNDWETPGAKGAVDRGSVVLGTLDVDAPGSHVVDLNDDGVGLVQRWIDAPQSNYGMILVPAAGTSGGVKFESREALNSANRPSLSLTFAVIETPANVVGRHIYYNNSALDGSSPSAGPEDDEAIAAEKWALLPGETATFANYTSFAGGMNGIMIDVAQLAEPGGVSAADFVFRVSNDNNDPATWSDAPSPANVSVRPGAGVYDSDRISITWTDGAIRNQWLQVTVKSTAAIGLTSDDVFYFGNAVGETGNSATDTLVNAADVIAIRDNPRGASNPAPITDPRDVNRDGLVDAMDMILARNNATSPFTALRLKLPPLPPLPAIAPVGSGEGVLWRVRGSRTGPTSRPLERRSSSAVRATFGQHGLRYTPQPRMELEIKPFAGLDDPLLDLLAVDLLGATGVE